ncbi:uncharacterized protein V6R79_000003 [Siganus canaliculatus]
MATAGKPTKKEAKKYIPTKTSLSSPFTPKWSPLPQEDMNFILKILRDKLVSTGLEKKEEKVFRPWKKKKDPGPAVTSEPLPQESQDAPLQLSNPKNGWTDVVARKQLAIGINEVTKGLERNELKLVLVCKSVKPQQMTNHLIALSATRGVPACQVPRLSLTLSEPLGLKSVLALGFRQCASKDDEVFTDTVDAITPRVPLLDVAWLQEAPPVIALDIEESKKGQKRKLKTESKEATDSASFCALQPLKVKKIIANSAKKKTKTKQ